MQFLDKDKLEKIYKEGYSMADIAKEHEVSVNKVVYWFKKYGIETRSISDAVYAKYNRLGNPFKISAIDSNEKKELFDLAIGLFLGEGTKKQEHSVRFANSDPQIISIFLRFLRKVCGVESRKIKAWINIFDDRVYDEALKFWSDSTNIPRENFYSPVIRIRKEGNYKNKSKYGTITILVSNTKLLKQIKEWCNSYLTKYADMAQW